LREILQKAQPELTSLRAEVATLKTAKQELGNKTSELRRLETKHEDLRSEMTDLKKVIDERDLEIKTLNQKISQEANGRLKAEDTNSTVQESLQRYEGEA
jgi:peptidoglycan hydrolase CwlO-like protein